MLLRIKVEQGTLAMVAISKQVTLKVPHSINHVPFVFVILLTPPGITVVAETSPPPTYLTIPVPVKVVVPPTTSESVVALKYKV